LASATEWEDKKNIKEVYSQCNIKGAECAKLSISLS